MAELLRWGVLGTGGIARSFIDEVAALEGHQVTAIGSRTAENAARAAGELGVPIAHSSAADLAAEDEVDVVYIATPHPAHAEGALTMIAAGKHVLVEKPFTMDAAQARQVADAARAAGVFAMEAMWTRFLPHSARIRELIAAGELGQVRTAVTEIGQRFAPDPRHRLFDPELGGGAMLDLGVYALSWSFMVLGTPSALVAASSPAMTGVDAQTSAVLSYPDGAQAVLSTTSEALTPGRAIICGTTGSIDVDPPFYAPTSFTLRRGDGRQERFTTAGLAGPGKGMRFEAIEVARCVRAGLTESPVLPLDETIAIMEAMDEIHRRIGRPGTASA